MSKEEQKHVNANQSQTPTSSVTSVEAFVKHMQKASEVVRTWPAWKQQVLGNRADQPSVAKVPNPTGQ
jgi:hypothetical protein